VVVKMAEGVSSEIWYPVWVEGDFKISKVDHAYGQAAFSLAGLKIEKYKH